MTLPEIKISRKITNQLLHLAQISPATEVCGLIGSQQGRPSSCYPIDNIADQPQQQFLLDPQQQIAAMTKMRERNENLLAIYHSHPTSPAEPSKIDIEMAAYPDALNFIISLNTKGVLELRGFKLGKKSAKEIPLVLEQN
jgi:proteasome lid subunit RPN8/RPN11